MDNEDKIYSGQEEINRAGKIFTRDKEFLTPDEKGRLKNVYKEAQGSGSNLWKAVISFDNRYLEEMGIYDSETGYVDEKRLKSAARSGVERLLEKEEMENAAWSGDIHFNTDNIHIHIAIVETSPMRSMKSYPQWKKDSDGKTLMRKNAMGMLEKIPLLDVNGNQIYRQERRGKFKNTSIEALKSKVVSELVNDKSLTMAMTEIMRDIVKDKKNMELMSNRAFKKEMKAVYVELKQRQQERNIYRNMWNYNQNALYDLKPKIDDLSDLFLMKYHRDDFEQIKALAGKYERFAEVSYGGLSSFAENRIKNLYERLGNAIYKEIQRYDREAEKQMGQRGVSKKDMIACDDHVMERNIARLMYAMDRDYTSWENLNEYEELQGEIRKRGEDIELRK